MRLWCGRATKLLTSTNGFFGSGLHWYVPLAGQVVTAAATLRVKEAPLQTIVTADGVEATFSLGVRWQVRDLRLLWTKVYDGTDTVIDLVAGTAGAVVPTLQWADLPTQLGPAMHSAAKKNTYGWGVAIHEIYLINLTRAPALRLLADSHHPLSGLIEGDGG